MIFEGISKDLQFKPNNVREYLDFLEKHEGKKLIAEIHRQNGVITSSQRNAMHLGFTLIADTLNNAGLDMRKVLKPEVNIPWTKDSVKEYLFRPIQKVMTSKKSTNELNKVGEIDEIWDVMMRHLMETQHIEYIPFPKEDKNKDKPLPEYPTMEGEITAF